MPEGTDRVIKYRRLEEAVDALAKAVAKRKEVEEELREREELLKTLFENSPIGIYRTTPDGRILMVNPALLRMLNYSSAKEATDRNLEEDYAKKGIEAKYFVPEYDRASFKERIEREGQLTLEARWKRSDGAFLWVRENARVFRDESGAVKYYEGTVEDITEKRKLEEELLEREELLKTLFENSPIGIYRTTPDGRILMANPALYRMLGYASFEELARRNLDEDGFEPSYDRAAFKERMARDGFVSGLEVVWNRSDGTRIWVRENAKTVLGEDGEIQYFEGTVENITDRKQAEEFLRQAKEDWERTFDAVPDMIFLLDENSRIIRANRTFLKTVRMDEDEVFGRKCHEIVHGSGLPVQGCPHQKTMCDNEMHEAEMWEERLNAFIHVTTSPLRDADGTMRGSVHVARDITARKRMEDDIRQSQERFSSLVSNIPGVVYRCDVQMPWRMHYISPDIEDLSGYSAEDFHAGKVEYAGIVHPDDLMHVDDAVASGVSNREAYEIIYRIVRKDGTTRWVLENGRAVYGDGGEALWLDGVIIDITERNKAEEALKKELTLNIALMRVSSLLLKESVDMSEVAETALEHARRLTHSDHGFVSVVEHLNREGGENPLKMLAYNTPGTPSMESMRKLQEAMFTNRPSDIKSAHRAAIEEGLPPGCHKTHRTMYVPVMLGSRLVGQFCLSDSDRDYTGNDLDNVHMLAELFAIGLHRKRLENQIREHTAGLEVLVASKTRELETSYEKLKRIDEMRTEFIDVAAHELRTPLSSIKVYLDLMQRGQIGVFAPNDKEIIDDIARGINRLNSLISAMLDFSRSGTKSLELSDGETDLSALAEGAVADFASLAKVRDVSIATRFTGNTFARVDAELVKRAIVNLVSNAVKYTSEGGGVKVSVDGTGRDVIVIVEDTGIGITEEDMEHMFERFYIGDTSLTRGRDSFGLGLPIVKNIVERHGGRVWVESEEGKGSAFGFALPRSPPSAPSDGH